jgi:hypothetical protein
MANAYKDIPTKEECQRIKALNFDLIALLNKYKGNMTSDRGNHLLDLLDGVQVQAVEIEQSAFDDHRAYVKAKGGKDD